MNDLDAQRFRKEVLEYLQERRENGKTFVKTAHVANDLDETPQRAGTHLDMLAQRGYLERWNPDADVPIWEIGTEWESKWRT